MKLKRYIIVLLGVSMLLATSGCGKNQTTDLNEDESEEIQASDESEKIQTANESEKKSGKIKITNEDGYEITTIDAEVENKVQEKINNIVSAIIELTDAQYEKSKSFDTFDDITLKDISEKSGVCVDDSDPNCEAYVYVSLVTAKTGKMSKCLESIRFYDIETKRCIESNDSGELKNTPNSFSESSIVTNIVAKENAYELLSTIQNLGAAYYAKVERDNPEMLSIENVGKDSGVCIDDKSDECVGILVTSFKYTDSNDIAFDKFVYKDIEDNIVISYNTETQKWEESTENPEESSISFPS